MLRLFHGTSLAIAQRIWDEGFRAFAPAELIGDLERRFDVPPGVARDFFYEYASARSERNEVSLADTWRLAASYARNGPEVEWMALCAIGRHLTGGDDSAGLRWAEQAKSHAPAVVTLELSRADAESRFGADGLAGLLRGPENLWPFYAGQEVVLDLPVPASVVARIDVTTMDCKCPPKSDWAAPCDLCCSTLLSR